MKAALLALFVLGCNPSKPADSDPDLARVRKMRDAACACKDLACIRAASLEYQKGGEPKTRTPEFDKLLEEAGACAAKLKDPARPSGSFTPLPSQ